MKLLLCGPVAAKQARLPGICNISAADAEINRSSLILSGFAV
tara:strand:+ start:650 stop:775 length:126 start_codon:yes stop_codon:yes gene_type:complete